MEQRDFVLREIEKIGAMLLALIGKLKSISPGKQFAVERVKIDKDLKSITGLTMEEILTLPVEDIASRLLGDSRFDEGNMGKVAEIMALMSDLLPELESDQAMERELGILELIEREGKTYSFERQSRIALLKEILE